MDHYRLVRELNVKTPRGSSEGVEWVTKTRQGKGDGAKEGRKDFTKSSIIYEENCEAHRWGLPECETDQMVPEVAGISCD